MHPVHPAFSLPPWVLQPSGDILSPLLLQKHSLGDNQSFWSISNFILLKVKDKGYFKGYSKEEKMGGGGGGQIYSSAWLGLAHEKPRLSTSCWLIQRNSERKNLSIRPNRDLSLHITQDCALTIRTGKISPLAPVGGLLFWVVLSPPPPPPSVFN